MVVTSFLECGLYIVHTKRNTTEESYLVGCLTRDTTAEKAWSYIPTKGTW